MPLVPSPLGQDYRCALRSGNFSGSRRIGLSSLVESIYVILTLAYMTSPFQGLFAPPAQLSVNSTGNVSELLLQTFVFLTAGVFIMRRWRSFVRGIPDCKWAIVVVALALASALWAADPPFAIRKGLIFLATTMFGIYFGTRYRRHEQVILILWAVGLLAVMSISMVVLFPQYGIDHFVHPGDWRGVFITKNTMARVVVLGVVALCCSPRRWLGTGVPWFVCLVAFSALIVLSGSATALVTGVLLFALTRMYRLIRLPVTTRIPILMASLLVSVLIVTAVIEQREVLLALLGRDATLTGRVPLWNSVLASIGGRPLLGYGFDSFWNGMAGPSAAIVIAVGWVPPYAHNGFLDICLDLGVVGLLAFGTGFVMRFRSAILEYRALGYRSALWPLAFLSFLLLYNLTDSTILHPLISLHWALYTASLIREARAVVRVETESGRAKDEEMQVDGCPA